MNDLFAAISSAANSGASGINGYALPTAAQAKSGNYRKGRVTLYGLNIAIETPQGQARIGKEDGKPWSVICMAHYGDIEGTRGADGDPVDVYVGPVPESTRVFVVNQTNKDGSFDEHKVLLGFQDEQSARAAYLGSYERGWDRFESILSASVDQFKWWLKYGNTTKPFTKNALPYSADDDMSEIQWDSAAMPANTDLGSILYSLRRHADADLLLDAASLADVLEDADGVDIMDALVVESAKLGIKMEQLRRIMESAGDSVKPVSMQISEPFRQKGTTNITALFELSDGQTVAIFFHNPDSTPNKILPQDELVSWKWLLNKMDITILVAPEKGRDLNPREVARRVMRLAEKNSARFQKANSARAERMASIEQGRADIAAKEGTLAALEAEIAGLTEKVAAKRSIQAPAPDAPLGVSATEATADVGVNAVEPFADIARRLIPAEFETKDSVGDDITAVAVDGFGMRLRLTDRAVATYALQPDVTGQESLTSNTISVGIETAVSVSVENALMFIEKARASLAQQAEPEEQHYSDKILAELVASYGWKMTATGSIEKNVGGGATGGEFNSEGARIVVASFDEQGRYLTLSNGFENVLDMDMRDIEPNQAAATFNAKVAEWADGTAVSGNTPESLDEELVTEAVAAARQGSGGITRLATSKFFTFGEDILLSDELRAKVEEALGEKLVEHVFEGNALEVALVPASMVAAEPALQPEAAPADPAAQDDQSAEARALLQSVIDGTADLSDADLPDRMEAIYNQFEADAEMMDLFEQAANAYSDAIVAQASAVIAK